MLDNLYTNLDQKIKSLAKGMFIIGSISSVTAGLVLLIDAGFEDGWWGLLLIVLGPVACWIASWITYGIGELLENAYLNTAKLDKILISLSTQNVPHQKNEAEIKDKNKNNTTGKHIGTTTFSATNLGTIICNQCNYEQQRNRTICCHCGANFQQSPAVPFRCGNCGQEGPYDGNCPTCGSSIKRFTPKN